MVKKRPSFLSVLFPWLAPFVIKFVIVDGGIIVRLYRNDQLQDWHSPGLRRAIPAPFMQWIDAHHVDRQQPLPYPQASQLWKMLLSITSKNLHIDASELIKLKEVSQPQNFGLVWTLNRSQERLEGHYEGADRYLGMGWFQRGTNIWALHNTPPDAVSDQFNNLVLPVQKADFLLASIIPYLRDYLPVRADFQIITDFAFRINVLSVDHGSIRMSLQCNYPQSLPFIQIPQQAIDVLFADNVLIKYPRQLLTMVVGQLLQQPDQTLTIQGGSVPYFIREQLPALRHSRWISAEIVEKITQANPIATIDAVKPTFSFIHTVENGIGKYTTLTTYRYQQQQVDMDALVQAYEQGQRFVYQHQIWFEWPQDSRSLFMTIRQQREVRVLSSEEIMGFETRHHTVIPGVKPEGETIAERGKSLLQQLRYHGIPGGIIGEPDGMITLLARACEQLWREHRQARILWLAPSNKKGSVTRALKNLPVSSVVTVASPVTLRDEPMLARQMWTMVVIQEFDQLLRGDIQSNVIFQLLWQWAVISVTSESAVRPFMMQALKLSETHSLQFCAQYLFNLTKQRTSIPSSQEAPPIVLPPAPKREQVARPTRLFTPAPTFKHDPPPRTIELNQQKVARLYQETELLQERLIVEDEEEKVEPVTLQAALPSSVQETEPVQKQVLIEDEEEQGKAAFVQTLSSKIASVQALSTDDVQEPSSLSASVQLDLETISRLQSETDLLLDRLVIEEEEEIEIEEEPSPLPDSVPDMVEESELASVPAVDEDWIQISRRWEAEHWEILLLLYHKDYSQLATVQRKFHRPISLLIDEINRPVDEQLGDLLVDPDTQSITDYLLETTEHLVNWYHSSNKGR